MSNPEEEISAWRRVENSTGVDKLSKRLAEVTRLAERLDERLCEAGARIRTTSPECPQRWLGKTEEMIEIGEKELDDEGSCTEDYVTASECATTPPARSRSQSFATQSGCDDGLSGEICNGKQDAAEERITRREATNLDITSVPITSKIDTSRRIVSEDSGMANTENRMDVPNLDRTKHTSVIQKVEEKSGKIMKEVTETTTLRVSQDTRFGVASYKLISNTLRESHDHADVKGILDTMGFCVKTDGCGNGNDELPHEDGFCNYNREELSQSTIDAETGKLENGHRSKFRKMIRESSQRENRSTQISDDASISPEIISFELEDARSIEMTPKINGSLLQKDEDSEELLERMKKVSCS